MSPIAFLPRNALVRTALGMALSLVAPIAGALDVVPYSAPALAAAQKAGQPVVLQFHATWCPTCKAQDKVFESLKSDAALKVTLMQADYDTEKALAREMKITAQSTLVVFHGATERARVVGETDPARLKALLERAL